MQKAAGYGSIRLVQLKGADSDWMGMTNKYGAAWEVPVTPKLPWDFRIVSDDGQEVMPFQSHAVRVLAEARLRQYVALPAGSAVKSSHAMLLQRLCHLHSPSFSSKYQLRNC